ncbi:hypothetical protein TRIUR3_02651 [Triticum urartu]|uniref:Malectin-like domain-containing protein n=1 Tax=Triticum urartu TaxID=4572 RepID=M7YFA2_TRIUA|nr:hypothetical protein TRIUR3_02651 [Triticum urartu]
MRDSAAIQMQEMSSTGTGSGAGLVAPPELQWPPAPLPKASYYLALYFQDNRAPSPLSWRVFDVAVNGQAFFAGLNVSTAGAMLYGAAWPLSGQTKITLTPAPGSPVGPVINAAEVMMVVPLGGRTHPRDVIGMEGLARGFANPPSDWSGDPCLPVGNSWTGVSCSQGALARVTALNLTNFSVEGSISDHIANLTAISSVNVLLQLACGEQSDRTNSSYELPASFGISVHNYTTTGRQNEDAVCSISLLNPGCISDLKAPGGQPIGRADSSVARRTSKTSGAVCAEQQFTGQHSDRPQQNEHYIQRGNHEDNMLFFINVDARGNLSIQRKFKASFFHDYKEDGPKYT